MFTTFEIETATNDCFLACESLRQIIGIFEPISISLSHFRVIFN